MEGQAPDRRSFPVTVQRLREIDGAILTLDSVDKVWCGGD